MEDEFLDGMWESQNELPENDFEPSFEAEEDFYVESEPDNDDGIFGEEEYPEPDIDDSVGNYEEYESPSTGLFGGDVDYYGHGDFDF